jgi:hypothetical protein
LETKNKLIGISLVVALPLAFASSTLYEYYKKTRTIQFSAFGGWQMAANALYGYSHANLDPANSVPNRFTKLHNIVNRHMDSLHKLQNRPDNEVATYYLWDLKSPLRTYMKTNFVNDTSKSYFVRWSSVAPLYRDYGFFLIKKHPWLFTKFYLWPNLMKYYSPPPKFMGLYNMGREYVEPITVAWFKWESNKIHSRPQDKKIAIIETSQIMFPIINLLFIMGVIGYFTLGGYGKSREKKQILICVISIWITNILFSVFAAPIELRYQIFPFIINFCTAWLTIAFIIKQSSLKQYNIKEQINEYLTE